MMHDLWRRGLPDDNEEVIARTKEVAKLVSDEDGYSMGTWFKPPVPEDAKERQLALASREEILETYKWACSLWEDHPEHKALKESFEALSADLGSNTKINKLLCIGLESLSPPPYYSLEALRKAYAEAQENQREYFFGDAYFRPYFQHLAAQTMAQVLKGNNDGKPLDLYAQEIGYREGDIEVLENDVGNLRDNHARGGHFTVLDGSLGRHEGFLKIDSETFVFTVQPTMPLRQMVCETSSPAAMLCLEIKTKGEEPDEEVHSFKVLEAKPDEVPRQSAGLHLPGPHMYLNPSPSLFHLQPYLLFHEADLSNVIQQGP
ncbi:hypothetical protein PG984_004802 [Apiospora sp. TS-2023a]